MNYDCLHEFIFFFQLALRLPDRKKNLDNIQENKNKEYCKGKFLKTKQKRDRTDNMPIQYRAVHSIQVNYIRNKIKTTWVNKLHSFRNNIHRGSNFALWTILRIHRLAIILLAQWRKYNRIGRAHQEKSFKGNERTIHIRNFIILKSFRFLKWLEIKNNLIWFLTFPKENLTICLSNHF
jgi:hypothetical protein